ncbi:HopJ type III effector protein [Thalassomonas sp. M1454]|uniref:HopJ type III effector protein n=1 Tax=Thalassomonas sp. M1454 TaxID=2594477 RepID=UPI00117C6AF9|nr:HopJ type III effector protein [Thalassomonas sp. M1454]TRX54466.1 HopJ type III effector protein [Thalassomonas sp. M1454]
MLKNLLNQLNTEPENVIFSEVISVINQHYIYTPTSFINGDISNDAGTNEGSCKIFAFAQLNNLSEQQTLACFGDYYRIDVLLYPEANDHANIRNFIKTGWQGIKFAGAALQLKA